MTNLTLSKIEGTTYLVGQRPLFYFVEKVYDGAWNAYACYTFEDRYSNTVWCSKFYKTRREALMSISAHKRKRNEI